MEGKAKTGISPTRAEDFPQWFQSVVRDAEVAELDHVRGAMVIRPWGYGIWELMQRALDDAIKETGAVNAYFPLFIPLSYFEEEAKHVEGFAKEMAVVTHHRLEQGPDGALHPAAELPEPLIVRPTSETIIGRSFAKWINSYRDLPLMINQWANIVRWELRPRVLLRTTEFLWQEGHTAHATEEEAREETRRMLEVYREFAEQVLAIPVIPGEKPESERFPGAESRLSIEAMMQDGKALQSGTSHYLGQNFSAAMEMEFTDEDGERKLCYTTSWGLSTRMMGAVVMTHADDNGLRVPPRVAPQPGGDRPDHAGRPGGGAGGRRRSCGPSSPSASLGGRADPRRRRRPRPQAGREALGVDPQGRARRDRARRARHRAGRGDDDPPRRPRASRATPSPATAPPKPSRACSATSRSATSRRPTARLRERTSDDITAVDAVPRVLLGRGDRVRRLRQGALERGARDREDDGRARRLACAASPSTRSSRRTRAA